MDEDPVLFSQAKGLVIFRVGGWGTVDVAVDGFVEVVPHDTVGKFAERLVSRDGCGDGFDVVDSFAMFDGWVDVVVCDGTSSPSLAVGSLCLESESSNVPRVFEFEGSWDALVSLSDKFCSTSISQSSSSLFSFSKAGMSWMGSGA